MFDVIHKYKGSNALFATVKADGNHNVNLSAYGILASSLLEKYLDDQRDDNEELFTKWDESYRKAVAKTGFSSTHEAEDGYVYISTFQDGIGITPEDRTKPGKNGIKDGKKGVRIQLFQSDEDDFDDTSSDVDDDYDG